MEYKKFYHASTFTFLMEGTRNWDYYLMQYKDEKPSVVSIAKPGSGCQDSFFGDLDYFEKMKEKKLL